MSNLPSFRIILNRYGCNKGKFEEVPEKLEQQSWAAMIAVACGAGLVVIISVFLKMNLLLEVIVVLTMVFNWLNYLGGRI